MMDPRNFTRTPKSAIEKVDINACPVCDALERDVRFTATEHEYQTTTCDPFRFVSCKSCTVWFLDPRPAVSELGTIYPPNYYAYVQDAMQSGAGKSRAGGLFSRLGSWLFKQRIKPIGRHIELAPDKRWLDVGCGNGAVLQAMKDAYGMQGVGVDYSESSAAFCRSRGFEAFAGRFEDMQPKALGLYDLVHSSHVIEHLESPLEYLHKCRELLRPGGYAVFITPNVQTWEARLFGRHWGGLHVPRHWSLLNEKSARILAARSGLEYVQTHYSTNGTFWTWSFHSALRRVLPARINDALFPSDWRFIRNNLWNVVRIGAFTVLDMLNCLIQRRSANMLVILRRPAD